MTSPFDKAPLFTHDRCQELLEAEEKRVMDLTILTKELFDLNKVEFEKWKALSAKDLETLKAVEAQLSVAIIALEKYGKAFQTIEAQMNIRPTFFGVWKKQMDFLLDDAPLALTKIRGNDARNKKPTT